MGMQLAREFGASVIGIGRAADRESALDYGANEFVELDNDFGPSGERPNESPALGITVESDRAQLVEIVQRVREGGLRTNAGAVATLGDAIATFNSTERHKGTTVIRVDS